MAVYGILIKCLRSDRKLMAVKGIFTLINRAHLRPEGGIDTLLCLELPCKEIMTFQSPDDIPTEDVPCTCGDPNHFFIKFEDIDEETLENG